jgi:hypothetical protein
MGTSSICRTWWTGLPSGNIRVMKDDVGYYLSAAVIDNPPEGQTFYEAAQDLLPIVNGIGSLKSAKFRPVKLDGRYQHGTLTWHARVGRRRVARGSRSTGWCTSWPPSSYATRPKGAPTRPPQE